MKLGMMTEFEAIVMQLVDLGIPVTLRLGDNGIIATFENGFYKSDGMATLREAEGVISLHTRYGMVDEIKGPLDVIEASNDWHKRSRNRFEGWNAPASEWGPLYDLLDEIAK